MSLETASPSEWTPDILGAGFEARTLALPADDEGEVCCTLVRYRPDPNVRPIRVVLYLHGWSDYFFQSHLAEYWASIDVAFYALDLRKYGRSLRDWQTPGFITDLATYDEDIEAALTVIRAESPLGGAVMLMGHSTGGLVASLWTNRHPGEVRGLILNSPWLELQGTSIVRNISQPTIKQLARINPKQGLPNLDLGYYTRAVSAVEDSDLDYNHEWRPTPSFTVRPAWLNAVMDGHAQVAAGLDIDVPILALASARFVLAARWNDSMLHADSVLDTRWIAKRAVQLGRVVTVARIEGGLHDLVLSAQPARSKFFNEITRWSFAYGWLEPRETGDQETYSSP